MWRMLIGTVGLLLCVAPATATPYWVDYLPANGLYPEECGWTRETWYDEAQRWFDDGSLVMDSRASISIADAYSMLRPGHLDPDPGEVFIMSWRMRTDELQGLWDPAVGLFSDERRLVELDFSLNGVHVPGEGLVATFEPAVFHSFEFRSTDMLAYDLHIDGALAYSGAFTAPLLTASMVAWGDETQGGASLTRWQRFGFGVVPEPMSALMGVVLLAVARRPGSAHRHRKEPTQCCAC